MDEEKEMATIIRDLEDTAYGILEAFDDLREILEKKPEREERTRAGRVDRLHKAINEVQKQSRTEPKRRRTSRKVNKLWREAEEPRWCLRCQ